MLTRFSRSFVPNGVSSSLIRYRPLSISNIFFQGAKTKDEKVLRVEDSLKDLSSVKWRTDYNGKRLWPHDQWPERDLVNYPLYKLREAPNPVRWYCVPES
ncbi:unnamed protein product [Rotaria sordida]|uniref:Uncharacterized protein n=1 Tax=Rotaria sordida TaxID=392033 RepID=A0A815PSS4_9BILA|nr:unnamed protein product [Rotaria sordida]CAF1454038.1 unnamed protein product [Rotaria sordida]